MPPPLEYERKFLVEDPRFLGLRPEGTGMVQGYLRAQNGYSVRVRLVPAQDIYEFNWKGPRSGISRTEEELSLSAAQASSLLQACGDAVLDKTRYPVLAEDGRLWTVDVFHGKNDGLILAEVELADPGDSFLKPDWAIKEVTGDSRYYNDYLAFNPFRSWPIVPSV